jgi:prepilin-type N-terminal cleavage/methylation domain-containing protein
MKKGFSLLEIVLALGILGVALPLLISQMAENSEDSVKRTQISMAQNMEKNLQCALDEIRTPLPLDTNHCTFCGYKNDCFTIATASTGWDNTPLWLIEREEETLLVGNSVKHITYNLYPWNTSAQTKQEYWKGIVYQWIVQSSLGS